MAPQINNSNKSNIKTLVRWAMRVKAVCILSSLPASLELENSWPRKSASDTLKGLMKSLGKWLSNSSLQKYHDSLSFRGVTPATWAICMRKNVLLGESPTVKDPVCPFNQLNTNSFCLFRRKVKSAPGPKNTSTKQCVMLRDPPAFPSCVALRSQE